MSRLPRRAFLAGTAALGMAATFPAGTFAQQRIVLNDASRLNPVPVMHHWIAGPGSEAAFVERLRNELKSAAADRRPVAVGCARHSMGGQSLPRDGVAVTLETTSCELDRSAGMYRVHAGTRWRDVIGALDPVGFSPAVMQSNNDFGIAGTLSVNAHGWPAPFGPFGSTVRAFRMMLADGTVLTCSRTENPELFGLAVGGYGLFGVIIDVDLDMVANMLLAPAFDIVPGPAFGTRLVQALERDPTIRMAYGRLPVDRDGFFDEALMVTYRPLHAPADGLPRAGDGGILSALSREIFRAQIGSDTIKDLRWFAETKLGPTLASGATTRNALLNEPVANLAGRDRSRTDILHEYFVPPDRFGDFLAACREAILPSGQELLNVTLRYVATDDASLLAYAPAPRIAAVMLFSQAMTAEAEADMRRMTEDLIDRVLDIGGTFYLPYRLHARPDQVARAYPACARFVARKHHYDPGLLFRNVMWDRYFAA